MNNIKPFCHACQAIPAHGYCRLNGCPMPRTSAERPPVGTERSVVDHVPDPGKKVQNEAEQALREKVVIPARRTIMTFSGRLLKAPTLRYIDELEAALAALSQPIKRGEG